VWRNHYVSSGEFVMQFNIVYSLGKVPRPKFGLLYIKFSLAYFMFCISLLCVLFLFTTLQPV